MAKVPRLPRPAQAVGITHITQVRAWTLIIAFLASISLPLLVDLLGPARASIFRTVRTTAHDVAAKWLEGHSLINRITSANQALLAGFAAFENVIEDESTLSHHTRPIVQEMLLRVGAGNEKTYAGQEGWLFYGPEIDYLTSRTLARKPDVPERAIASFAADLAERGVRLVLLPTPGKPLIHPEKFSGGASALSQPPQRPDWEAFRNRLERACREAFASRGLNNSPQPMLVDPTGLLWDQKAEGPQFLRSDSHWRPEAMESVAAQVAQSVLGDLQHGAVEYNKRDQKIFARGDTSSMLQLAETSPWNRSEEVTISRVLKQDGSQWRPDSSSPVLLLGDSFSNIYSQNSLGWGEGAGFAEHLSAKLGFPVDAITRNDDGASATRRILAEQIARGNDRLAHKKVVLWQFAMRELATGRWELTPLAARKETSEGSFLVLKPGEERRIQGKVRAIGPIPRPADTPYKDYLTAFQIGEISNETATEAIVYLPTMQDHQLTPAAKLQAGDEVALILTSWVDAEQQYGGINRGELEDENLLLEQPNFARLAR